MLSIKKPFTNQKSQVNHETVRRVERFKKTRSYVRRYKDFKRLCLSTFKTPSARFVAEAFADLSVDGVHEYQPSQTTQSVGVAYLSEMAGISERSVRRGLKELRDAGWIIELLRGKKNKGCSLYFVVFAEEYNFERLGVRTPGFDLDQFPRILRDAESQQAKLADILRNNTPPSLQLKNSNQPKNQRSDFFTQTNLEQGTDAAGGETHDDLSAESRVLSPEQLQDSEAPAVDWDAFKFPWEQADQQHAEQEQRDTQPQPLALVTEPPAPPPAASRVSWDALDSEDLGDDADIGGDDEEERLQEAHESDDKHRRLCKKSCGMLLALSCARSDISRAERAMLRRTAHRHLDQAQDHRERLRITAHLADILSSRQKQNVQLAAGKSVKTIRNIVGLFVTAVTKRGSEPALSYYATFVEHLKRRTAHLRARHWSRPPVEVVNIFADPVSAFSAGSPDFDLTTQSGSFWSHTAHRALTFVASGKFSYQGPGGELDVGLLQDDIRRVCADSRVRFEHFKLPQFSRLAGALTCFYAARAQEDQISMNKFRSECHRLMQNLRWILDEESGSMTQVSPIQREMENKKKRASECIYNGFAQMTKEEVQSSIDALKLPIDVDIDSLMKFEKTHETSATHHLVALIASHHYDLKQTRELEDMVHDMLAVIAAHGFTEAIKAKDGQNIAVGDPIGLDPGITREEVAEVTPEEFFEKVNHTWLKRVLTPYLISAGVDVNTEALKEDPSEGFGATGLRILIKDAALAWMRGECVSTKNASFLDPFLASTVFGYLLDTEADRISKQAAINEAHMRWIGGNAEKVVGRIESNPKEKEQSHQHEVTNQSQPEIINFRSDKQARSEKMSKENKAFFLSLGEVFNKCIQENETKQEKIESKENMNEPDEFAAWAASVEQQAKEYNKNPEQEEED